MKVNIEIDCTPLEARQFFGLPDVSPMQIAVMDKLQQQMLANIDKVTPEAIMQSWFTFDPKLAAPSEAKPTSTPLTACIETIACASRPSRRESHVVCAPSPMGRPRATTSKTPPTVSPVRYAWSTTAFIRASASASTQPSSTSSFWLSATISSHCAARSRRSEPTAITWL